MTNPIIRAFVLGCLCFSAGAIAQSAAADSLTFDQIIVTGARTPLSITRIGSATTVITRQEIERRQVRYVTELLRSVPGFSVSHTGVTGSQTQVRVRGSEANHVLVLIDGVRANDPATGDEFRWEHLSASNIERIEIVRGAQSALWGSDAIGAVVHIVTRNGVAGQAGNLYAEGGSNNTFNVGANGQVQVGGWSISAGLESLDTDGANISRTGTESDGSDLLTGSTSARYSWSDAATFSVGLRVTDATSQTDPVDFFVTGLPVDGDQETQSKTLMGDVSATWLAHDDRVKYRLSARYYDSDHRNLTDGIEVSSTASERVTLALQSDIRLGENELSLAIEQEDTDYEQRGEIVFGDPNQDQDMQVSSAIAEYQHLSGDKLTWLLSARFDKNSDFDDALTGKVSLAYQVSDTSRLRASVGSGYKTPTFTERFGFFPGQFIGNPDLKPETSVSYDVGWDMDLLGGALLLQTSIFVQELEDEINGFVFDPDTFLGTAENRSGTSERSGVELAAKWHVSDQWSAAATYTYTDSREEDASGAQVTEVRRPRHSGSLLFDFTSKNERFSALLSADYGGERTDLFFPPFPEPQQTVRLDSFWLVDLTANFQLASDLTLFVRGTNLLDEDYEQVFGYQTLGRSGYVGLRASFGQ